MTNEPDCTSGTTSASAPGRRPPTIELTAAEVEQPKSPQEAAESQAEPQAEAAASTEKEPQDASNPQATTQEAPGPQVPGSRGSLWTHAISAAIGATAAAAVLVGLWLFGFTLARDVVNSQLAAQDPSAANAEIVARLDKIEHALQTPKADTATVPPALTNRLTTVEMQTKTLSDSAAALNHRVDDIAASAQAAQKQAATSAASAQEAAKSAGQASAVRSDLEALSGRIAALESAVKTLSDEVAHPKTGIDQAVRLAVAAQALRTAVETGTPYQTELKAVQALGAQDGAIAPLQTFAATGLPRTDALAHELAALVPPLRAAAEPMPANASFFDRLKANALKLVDITPVEAPQGNDPASVMTRIKLDANRGDIAAALTDIAALPDPAKALAADWAKKAQAREAAVAASRSISAAALAALSKPAVQ